MLSELGSLTGNSYTFVGTNDHGVSCLNYGNSTATLAQARVLSSSETARAHAALADARMLISSASGILGVAMGKSSDSAGEAAVVFYVDQAMNVNVPATMDGVRTMAIPTTAAAVAMGSAPQTILDASSTGLARSTLSQAIAIKQQIAPRLMKQNPAFFAVGVGQSLDNPKEAALVVYVDRNVPALAATVNGLRTRYVVMDRLHVTRSYATAPQSRLHCAPHPAAGAHAAHQPPQPDPTRDLETALSRIPAPQQRLAAWLEPSDSRRRE